MFLIKLWDTNDRDLIVDLHRKVIQPRSKLATQVNSVFKHAIKRILKDFLQK